MRLSRKAVAVILLLVSAACVWFLFDNREHFKLWTVYADHLQLSNNGYPPLYNNRAELVRHDKMSVDGHSSGPGVFVPKPYSLLLVMVLSSYGSEKRRDAIRQTWRNSYVEKGKQFPVTFVVGTLLLNSSATEQLVTENKKHNDLLLFHDHLDVYRNLTRKVLQMFIWVDHHMNYSYLLKIDDDSFARLDVIESELRERKSTKGLYWGYFVGNYKPNADGKWAEHNWFLSEKYLPYALGGGYVISADLVRRIVVNSDALTLYNSEDVSVGTWTSPFDIERKHDYRFQIEWQRALACDNRCIVVHRLRNAENIWEKHRNLTSIGVLCETESIIETYQCYRWNVTPSHCCSLQPCT